MVHWGIQEVLLQQRQWTEEAAWFALSMILEEGCKFLRSQSLPYCIFFNNTNCMKQLLQTQGDGNEKDSARSKYGHASPRYKKNCHQSAHGIILISICPSHKRITVDQNARTANVVRPTEHKHFDQDGLIWSWRKSSFSASCFNSCTVSW